MKTIDRRKVNENGDAKSAEPEKKYDSFKPTLAGFVPDNDCLLLRELVLPEEGMIIAPDAYQEECLFAENILDHSVVRILKGVGHTIPFVDGEPGQRYFTVSRQDVIGHWNAA